METTHRYIDLATGVETDLPLTADEIKEAKISGAKAEKERKNQVQAQEAKASAQAKLAALGLTADEIAALSL